MEFSILWYLCQHRGAVVSSEELFEAVWGEQYMDSNNTVMSSYRPPAGEDARAEPEAQIHQDRLGGGVYH